MSNNTNQATLVKPVQIGETNMKHRKACEKYQASETFVNLVKPFEIGPTNMKHRKEIGRAHV